MNTYGDPGADPVEEWGVERLTDMITPASLRATANWWADRFTEHDSFDLVRDVLNREAARLEAEAAHDEEAERLAKVMSAAMDPGSEWSLWPAGVVERWKTAVRAVLDRLAADGRLLPEGGTAEDSNSAGAERLQAEFARANDRMRRLPYAHRPVVTPPAVSVPDSGPDGTPEKPWPTAADVPDGTWFRTAKLPDAKYRWLRCGKGSTDYADMADPKTTALGFQVWDVSAVNDFAPFVRVDGEKA